MNTWRANLGVMYSKEVVIISREMAIPREFSGVSKSSVKMSTKMFW